MLGCGCTHADDVGATAYFRPHAEREGAWMAVATWQTWRYRHGWVSFRKPSYAARRAAKEAAPASSNGQEPRAPEAPAPATVPIVPAGQQTCPYCGHTVYGVWLSDPMMAQRVQAYALEQLALRLGSAE